MIIEENQPLNESNKLSDINIFTKIWISPREVFKYLNDYNYDNYVYLLLIFAGITRAFDKASIKNMGDYMPLNAVLVLCIILGGLLGWITYYLYAALLYWTGGWLKGQGDKESLLRMIAYALIPSIVALFFFIPQIVFFGNGVFQSEIDIYGNGLFHIIIYYSTLVFELVFGIWTIVLLVIGISEIQRISIGKSILNMILPGLIILVPIAMIALIYRYLFG